MKEEKIEGIDPSVNVKDALAAVPSPEKNVNRPPPQQPEGGMGIGGHVVESAPIDTGKKIPGYVYALGRVVPRFPSSGVEKEFARVAGETETTGLTDRETFHAVLSKRENRYLARKLCWVLTIEGRGDLCPVPAPPRRPGVSGGSHPSRSQARRR